MVPMESNDDAWIAAVTSYIRNSFGNNSSLISTNDVARVRAAVKDRTVPWTLDELRDALPLELMNNRQWKVSASHNPNAAPFAVDHDIKSRYDTSASQTPGMWFQVELPEAEIICSLVLDAGSSLNDYPRGYQVQLSNDGTNWSQPVASGKGTSALTDITFAPAKTKFIRTTQTGSVDGLWWSIHELHIWMPGQPMKAKPAVAKKPEASKFE
jgi:F5/8 type C domain